MSNTVAALVRGCDGRADGQIAASATLVSTADPIELISRASGWILLLLLLLLLLDKQLFEPLAINMLIQRVFPRLPSRTAEMSMITWL